MCSWSFLHVKIRFHARVLPSDRHILTLIHSARRFCSLFNSLVPPHRLPLNGDYYMFKELGVAPQYESFPKVRKLTISPSLIIFLLPLLIIFPACHLPTPCPFKFPYLLYPIFTISMCFVSSSAMLRTFPSTIFDSFMAPFPVHPPRTFPSLRAFLMWNSFF